jgi:hypothetical protein
VFTYIKNSSIVSDLKKIKPTNEEERNQKLGEILKVLSDFVNKIRDTVQKDGAFSPLSKQINLFYSNHQFPMNESLSIFEYKKCNFEAKFGYFIDLTEIH